MPLNRIHHGEAQCDSCGRSTEISWAYKGVAQARPPIKEAMDKLGWEIEGWRKGGNPILRCQSCIKRQREVVHYVGNQLQKERVREDQAR